MVQILFLIIRSARPIQWIKNLALFTGLIFTGWLFYPDKFIRVFIAAIIFSILTSAVYIFNDLLDIEQDKLHPLKKNRPLASGKLPIPLAVFVTIGSAFLALFLAANLSFFFFLVCLAYILLHFLYTSKIKHIPILDVLALASGFILRVYAGAVVIDTHINIWLLLCIISFSLFLAVGKRRSELTLLSGKEVLGKTRKVLFSYPEKLLDLYISMFATTTWLTYAWYTFVHPSLKISPRLIIIWADIPQTFRSQKWLMATIPLVIYGVMRYLQLIYEKNEGESPAKVLVTDKPLLGTVIIWGLMVIGITYGLN
ncbi:decaprenyl-phosphate phosphoribosyltransferase [Candidatus Beckwithbacteria bacterium CG10_big_fil_rev_8_21_14_0_10_34_10]|uniref:Decaprenyl-phosphate phosphoribosyltransferase n=1 Tax=Candidatus Beckwithbacteria bacterium CG10_big_fil_rev_8_21_14_0_10_34_10 TaxID=1974495 RepID=A0A2H0W9E8_9BACT|nr:MAG: decaprenyl-phosphate phosphoribosyltransferase [Candidatus Beckwithbacteria bacterium CG10_big_fil_rev_8_21_14_0_10_34_10]